jgi:hypothetical protein
MLRHWQNEPSVNLADICEIHAEPMWYGRAYDRLTVKHVYYFEHILCLSGVCMLDTCWVYCISVYRQPDRLFV